MTWASLDDGFTSEAVWDGMPFEARWHYIALVVKCCAGRRYDGRLPRMTALRCSDVPDPEEALRLLVKTGLLADLGDAVQVVYIEQHVPPEGQRPEVLLPRKRSNQAAYRRRKCEDGEHSKNCPPRTCSVKVHNRSIAGNAGAGRGGQGNYSPTEAQQGTSDGVDETPWAALHLAGGAP